MSCAFLFTIMVYGQPTPPTNVGANPDILCPGSSTNLSAIVPSGYQVKWYTQASGGTATGTSASNASFSVMPSVTTTYYAETAPVSTPTTLQYTGNVQSWTVPAGITAIQVDAKGASGCTRGVKTGGKGGRVQATLSVTPGEVLVITVGGEGLYQNGGYNGGYTTTNTSNQYFRGGGATTIKQGSTTYLVAGGGGAASNGANGGNGGGTTAMAGSATASCAGGGAGSTSGGAGGTGFVANGTVGTSGVGGVGGGLGNSNGAGNGGGGYYGGGGGGSNTSTTNASGGGGGGSSYTINTATNVIHTQGDNTGNGTITITPIGLSSATREAVEVTVVGTPTNVQSANLTPTSIDLSWTAPTGAVGYEWKVVASGAGTSGTAIASSANASNAYIQISTLTQGTNYDFYVRAKCAAGSTSGWSSAFAFTTPIPPPVPEITLVKVRDMCSDRTTVRVTFKDPVNNPNTYSVTADIPNFSPILDATLPSSATSTIQSFNVSLSGASVSTGTGYTLTLTVKNALGGVSQDYFIPVMFHDIPTNIVSYTDAGLHFAEYSCLDANNWTHYINTTDNELLLSINEGNWDAGMLVTTANPGAGKYAVTIGICGTDGYKFVPAGGYVSLPGGWYVMSGTYDVIVNDVNTQEPTSPVVVRSYFEEAQFTAINNLLGLAGASYQIPSYNDLTVYKLVDHVNSYNALSAANPHNGIGSSGVQLYNNTSNDHPDFICNQLSGATGVRYFQYSVDGFSGGGGGGGAGGAMPGAALLPVELSSFTGHDWNNQVQLNWTTETEMSNHSFTVEKSVDGQIFMPLEEVPSLAMNGMSNIPLNYEYTDIYPQSFQYYRLKQTDIDGAMRVCSQTIQVPANVEFAAFPNPTSDEVYLLYKNTSNSNKYQAEVFNSLGIKVLTENYNASDVSHKLSLKHLPTGIYSLRISEEKGRILNQTTLIKK